MDRGARERYFQLQQNESNYGENNFMLRFMHNNAGFYHQGTCGASTHSNNQVCTIRQVFQMRDTENPANLQADISYCGCIGGHSTNVQKIYSTSRHMRSVYLISSGYKTSKKVLDGL